MSFHSLTMYKETKILGELRLHQHNQPPHITPIGLVCSSPAFSPLNNTNEMFFF